MLFSICLITYNRPNDTLLLLRNLARLTNWAQLLKEIVLINNNSDADYSAVENFVRQGELPINYVINSENLGVAKGRNQAARLAEGEFLIFLDDDVEIENLDFLSSIASFWQQTWVQEENVGILNLRILYHSTREIQQNAFPHKKFRQFSHLPEFFTYYFTGAAYIVRRQLFLGLGGFPEDFFYGAEEYDLSFRLLDKGYKIYYLQNPCILHKESPYGRLQLPEKWAQMWLNRTKVAYRYLPMRYVISTAFIWSSYFLLRFPLSLQIYCQTWVKIFRLARENQRKVMQKTTLRYLKKLQARLWY